MRVTIGEFSAIHLRGVDLGELYLAFRSDSHQLHPSSEGKLLKA
jgi:hypothetical protein